MKIGILTGGGDCPGLNAVIRGAVIGLVQQGHSAIGLRHGWKGLLDKETVPLGLADVDGIERTGGTILKTSRTNPYKTEETRKAALESFKALGLDAIIAVGGDDTLGACHKLTQDGVPAVGVPKTIDNDLSGTDVTFGFDTATNIVTEAIDRLHTTAGSHERILVVEIMGRHAGWITLHGGLAGGAHVILVPEEPFDLGAVAEVCKARRAAGADHTIVAVSEGAMATDVDSFVTQDKSVDEFGHVRLGGIGKTLAKELERLTGQEARHVVLGHLQRGGVPSAFDRVLGLRLGLAAAHAVHDKDFGKMVALKGTDIERVAIATAVGTLRTVPEERLEEKRQLLSSIATVTRTA
ncbi:MAG: ATP-dependent 6-phosphofructokinase [Euryarchaeota archaeon]|nr:ATP-dependent 6-phosphofructokinase [Euryarchaeota archaeon]